jgi:cytochrome b561
MVLIEDVEERLVYDRRTIWLHWVVAGTITFMWLLGRLNHLLPKGPLRLNLWSIHIIVGFCLAALIVARIVWRLRHGRRLPPAEHGVRHIAAVSVHYLLYLLMIAVVGLGIVHVSGFRMFGAFPLPTFWSKSVNHQIGDLHDLAANAIAVVVLLHALAALYHHYVVRDAVLRRMMPRL